MARPCIKGGKIQLHREKNKVLETKSTNVITLETTLVKVWQGVGRERELFAGWGVAGMGNGT